jgi:hypothetical protein
MTDTTGSTNITGITGNGTAGGLPISYESGKNSAARIKELEGELAFAEWRIGQKQEALDYADQRIERYRAARMSGIADVTALEDRVIAALAAAEEEGHFIAADFIRHHLWGEDLV